MKRFLYAVLLLSSPVYADSVTSGALGLLIPSTGVIDTTRRWDDKYNGNFRMIASSVGTIYSNLTALALDTTTLATATGTLTARVNQLSIDTGTLAAATATIRGILNQISIDTGTLATSTGALQNQFIVMNSTVMAIRTSTSSLETTLAQRTLVIDQGGGTPGQTVTRLSITGGGGTYTQIAGTGTLAIAAGGSKPYDLIVGTFGATGVDAIVVGQETYDAILASVSARGLAYSATAQATIFFKEGTYVLTMPTVPAGIAIYGAPGSVNGASTTFVDNGAGTQQFMRIFGTLKNVTLNLKATSFSSQKIYIGSNTDVDISVINVNQQGGLPNFNSTVYIASATNVNLRLKTDSIRSVAGNCCLGDSSGLIVQNSSDVTMSFPDWRVEKNADAANGTHMAIFNSSAVRIVDSVFRGWEGEGIMFASGGEFEVRRNKWYFGPAGPTTAGMAMSFSTAQNAQGVSTRAVVSDNYFQTSANITGPLISVDAGAPTNVNGLWIYGNTATCYGTNSVTFVTLTDASKGTVLQDNKTDGCATFLSNSGQGTVSASVGNFKGNTEQ